MSFALRSHDESAVRCLVSASEALLLPTPERRAAALLWCARALLYIADADKSGAAREQAEKVLVKLAEDRAAP